jgi:hypothetical protein
MCELWTNFAKYGNPTVHSTWAPVEGDLNYFILDAQPKMEKNLHAARMDFWRKIYRQSNKDFLTPKL